MVSGHGLRKACQPPGRAAAAVVDPVDRVGRQPDLRYPGPYRVGWCFDAHAPPCLQGWRGHEVVARVAPGHLDLGHAPPVANHASIIRRRAEPAVTRRQASLRGASTSGRPLIDAVLVGV